MSTATPAAANRPTYEQVLPLVKVSEFRVPEDSIDGNGHLETVRYMQLAARGLGSVCDQLGMGERYIRDRGLSIFTAEHHLTYVAELRLHSVVSVHVQLLERSDKALHAMAYLLDDTHMRLAYILESTLVHIDLTNRRPRVFPTDIGASIDRFISEHPITWAPPINGAMGIRRSPAP